MTVLHLDQTPSRSPLGRDGESSATAGQRAQIAANGLGPRAAWWLVAVYAVAAAAVALDVAGAGTSAVLIVTSTIALIVGIRINRPALAWPFWGFVVAGVFWMFAAVTRDVTGSTGDLTANRSLLPDLFALPGYAAYGVGLMAILRSRDGRNRGALTDAVIVAVAGFLLAWEFVIARTLQVDEASPIAQGAIVVYPVLGCAFVALACRLAFVSGRRIPVHGFLLVAMIGLLIGDVSYAIDELGILDLGHRRDLGYIVTAAAMGAAALHPSVRELHVRGTSSRRALPTARATLLAISLLLPSLLFIYGIDDPAVRALPFQLGVVVLAVIATFRLLDSVRDQNTAADTLSWQADHDGLTGLPNRNAINTAINERVSNVSGDLVIAYFDLDHFKNINDALGHVYGDQLLVAVARQLREQLPDHIVLGRIGGDEFVAVCDCDSVDADRLAQHILRILATPFHVGGFEASATASIGITVARGGRNADALLRDADTAMYRAKDAGRNTYAVFSDDMRDRVERRIRIERELRDALERGGEVRAWFQPLHDLDTGRVIGFEALARWITPSRIVPPLEFIDVAEDTGLITELGAQIIEQACATIAHVRQQSGCELFVTVNVSARQLVDDGIVHLVTEALSRHGLPGSALCLEITESIMVNEKNVERLRALCRLGVWLAVDDFGTGYSSLSYLHRMPISKVKIDKSFIDDIATGDPSIMVAILSMAHSLGLTCVAEGVETRDQAVRLRALGCDSAQGYLWSKPVPAETLTELVGSPVPAA